ncbi:MAG: DUF362 domain-containing protein [Planctomycetota bacterium]
MERNCGKRDPGAMSRRSFLHAAGIAGVAGAAGLAGLPSDLLAAAGGKGKKKPKAPAPPAAAATVPAKGFKDPNALEKKLAVVRGGDPAAATRKAIELLGGMDKLVAKGDKVVVKPNIGWDKPPEDAANTNPAIVAAVVEMCVEAGAAEVTVFDNPVNAAAKTYVASGIKAAVEAVKAKVGDKAKISVPFIDASLFRSYDIPGGSAFQKYNFYSPAVECNVLINLPCCKNHGGAGVTFGLKNLMGLIDDRGRLHGKMQPGIVDLSRLVKVDLTVLDAWKIMLTGGPAGGGSEYKDAKTIVAGIDRVALDAYALELMGRKAGSIEHIQSADGALEIPGGEKGSVDWKAKGLLEATL